MLRKSSPIILIGLLLALCFMLLVGGSVSAGTTPPTPTPIPAPHFNDNRVNTYDIAAPVAVFCKMTYPDANNTALKPANRYRGVLDRVELWGVTDSTHQFHEIAMVPASTINATPNTLGAHMDAENLGYELWHNADGSLTVVAPAWASNDGREYRFTWRPYSAQGC